MKRQKYQRGIDNELLRYLANYPYARRNKLVAFFVKGEDNESNTYSYATLSRALVRLVKRGSIKAINGLDTRSFGINDTDKNAVYYVLYSVKSARSELDIVMRAICDEDESLVKGAVDELLADPYSYCNLFTESDFEIIVNLLKKQFSNNLIKIGLIRFISTAFFYGKFPKNQQNLADVIIDILISIRARNEPTLFREGIKCLGFLGDKRALDILLAAIKKYPLDVNSIKGAFSWEISKMVEENSTVLLSEQLEISKCDPAAASMIRELRSKAKELFSNFREQIEKNEQIRAAAKLR